MDFLILLVALVVGFGSWKIVSKHYKNKNKGKFISNLAGISVGILLFFVTIALLAPEQKIEDKKQPINKELKQLTYKILNVSDHAHTLKNKPAVSITFGTSKENYIDITLHRESIKQNFELDTRKNKTDHNLVSITLNWDKNIYIQNTKNNEYYVRVKILELNETKKEAKIKIEANLYSIKTNTFKDVNTEITITNDDFINLTKQL